MAKAIAEVMRVAMESRREGRSSLVFLVDMWRGEVGEHFVWGERVNAALVLRLSRTIGPNIFIVDVVSKGVGSYIEEMIVI